MSYGYGHGSGYGQGGMNPYQQGPPPPQGPQGYQQRPPGYQQGPQQGYQQGPQASYTQGGGSYPGQQANNLMQIFQKVDRDRSGEITRDELQSALSNGSWAPFNIETVRLMIGMFDNDYSGTINFNEFERLWNYVDGWTKSFRQFDRDNSGNIDKGELNQALTTFGYRFSQAFYDLLLIRFDRTKSGRIAFDDFIQLCVVLETLTSAFRDRDQDRDGVITIPYEEFLTMVFCCNIAYSSRNSAPKFII